jgi:hypothetical protein
MEKIYLYKLIILSIFLLGVLYLGYTYITDQRYEAFSKCYQEEAIHDNNGDVVSIDNYESLCDLILTHNIAPAFTPVNWR